MNRLQKILFTITSVLSSVFIILIVLIFLEIDFSFIGIGVVNQKEYESYRMLKEISTFDKIIQEKYYQSVDHDALMEGAIRGMFASLPDGYSRYYTEEELAIKKQRDQGEYVGIGVELTKARSNEYMISKVLSGRPAEEAGLQVGDIILSVNGVELNDDNYIQVLSILRSPDREFPFLGDYTKVEMTIKRGADTLEFLVSRDLNLEYSVESDILTDIGYIRIDRFMDSTHTDFKNALVELHKQKISKLIIDLRDNPGGLVVQASDIAGLLLGDDKIIYYTKSKGIERIPHYSNISKQYHFDIVVLVNEKTASAAEILAAALKDHKAATILGEQTFGKGIIQTTFTRFEKDGYQITTSEYLTPIGDTIHKKGITPDVLIENDEAGEASDLMLEKAKELLK